MANCQLCQIPVGCPCNLKTTRDGKLKVCGSCLTKYNNNLGANNQPKQNVDYNAIAKTSLAPENVNASVKYNNFNV